MKTTSFLSSFITSWLAFTLAFATPARAKEWEAPNKILVCILVENVDGKADLFLQSRRDIHAKILLHSGSKDMEVNWSPDSQFVAVTDQIHPHRNALWIYSVAYKPGDQSIVIKPIYETPSDNEKSITWKLKRWDLTGRAAYIQKEASRAKGWKENYSIRVSLNAKKPASKK
jgi:hypothetical protein